MNPFRQKIGIWYTDQKTMIPIFKILVNILNESDVLYRYRISNSNTFIQLVDGTTIDFVSLKTPTSGRRFTNSYVYNISLLEYNTLVLPSTTGETYWIDYKDKDSIVNSFYVKERVELS